MNLKELSIDERIPGNNSYCAENDDRRGSDGAVISYLPAVIELVEDYAFSHLMTAICSRRYATGCR